MVQSFPEFLHQNNEINKLRYKVRYGNEVNNPNLVNNWFSMEESLNNSDTDSKWQLYQAQFSLLIDVLADDMLPSHWRTWCLDNIYKPLNALQRLVGDQQQHYQLNEMYNELRIISHRFQKIEM